MPSKDYLIRQIEEMSLFLALLLHRVLKMKQDNEHELIDQVVIEEFNSTLNFDVAGAIVLGNDDFLELVLPHFESDDKLDKLSDILKIMGQKKGLSFTLSDINYLKKSLFLFQYLQEKSTDFSFERREKILEIQEILRNEGYL